MANEDFENYSWELINDYIKEKGMAAHHIDSFDRFLNFTISKIIQNETDIRITKNDGSEYIIEFGEIYIDKPSMFDKNRNQKKIFPQDARIHDLTYASPIYIDVIQKNVKDGNVLEQNIYKRLLIATLPVIINSEFCNLHNMTVKERIEKGECENDIGGYFIIKGKERVLVGQLSSVYNTILVIKQKPKDRFLFVSEMRSISEETGHSVLIQCKLSTDERNVVFSVPYIKENILVGILFKAIGCVDYDEMFKYIGIKGKKAEKFYTYIKRDSFFIKTQDDALKYMGKSSIHPIKDDKKIDYAKQVVDNELFPHLGITGTKKEKLIILGKMVNKLINTHLGYRTIDDRDNNRYKRVQMAGELCADLFKTLYKRYIKNIQIQLEKKKFNPDITNIISRISSITTGMRQSFSTGNWGVQKNSYIRTGVSQVLNRLTYGASLSHLRRIAIPIGKEGKNVKIRQIHSSQIGFICPHECFDPDTEVFMYDGNIKKIKDIKIGELVIDDNGNPSKVKKTVDGNTKMFEIIPGKQNFMSHTVTENHILTLKIRLHKSIRADKDKFFIEWFDRQKMNFKSKSGFKTREEAEKFVEENIKDDDIIDIELSKYLKLPKRIQDKMVLFKAPCVNWSKKDVDLDPYILGMWLGDGSSDGSGFACNYKTDQILVDKWIEWGEENDGTIKKGRRYAFGISSTINNSYNNGDYGTYVDKRGRPRKTKKTEKAPLKKILKKYNLLNNKHIPIEYIVNDKETRLKVLAGLIDTDGSVRRKGKEIRIQQGPKNIQVVLDAYKLVVSLGFNCRLKEGKNSWTDEKTKEKKYGTYTELTITGNGISEIPTLLPRKKLFDHDSEVKKRVYGNHNQSKFKVVEKGDGEYAGIQIEGNQRFVLKDGIISH